MSIQITFDSSAREFVLDAFGKTVREGFVVEKATPTQKVLTPRGEEIPVADFAGVRKGSVIFVKTDIVSLVETAESIKT
ncbi:MAG: hypothetical protein WA117_11655 [Verrucomicrobiia bacterium]